MTRPRGFAPLRPQPHALQRLEQVRAVLHDYRDHLPLTIRQVLYRLVGNHGYDKTEAGYAKLAETLNRARRDGWIPFGAIRDDGQTELRPNAFAGPEGFRDAVRQAAEGYRIDRRGGQERRLWLLYEAGCIAPMLARFASPYGVPVLSSDGFNSLTVKYEIAGELAGCTAIPEALHVGDHDPSGVSVFQSLAEDIQALCEKLDGNALVFTRLAVTPAQIAELGLPTEPPENTDNRAFERETTQAEAIPPDVLADMVHDAIEARQNPATLDAVLQPEAAQREKLRQWATQRIGFAAQYAREGVKIEKCRRVRRLGIVNWGPFPFRYQGKPETPSQLPKFRKAKHLTRL